MHKWSHAPQNLENEMTTPLIWINFNPNMDKWAHAPQNLENEMTTPLMFNMD